MHWGRTERGADSDKERRNEEGGGQRWVGRTVGVGAVIEKDKDRGG